MAGDTANKVKQFCGYGQRLVAAPPLHPGLVVARFP